MVYTSSVIISVKIPKKLKKEAEELGIEIPDLLRKALEEEVRKRKLELLKEKLLEAKDVLSKIDIERFVRHIRENREEG